MNEPEDRPDDPPDGRPPTRRGPAAPTRLFVGLAFIALIVVVGDQHPEDDREGGLLGAGGDRGMALPEFAVPEARGPVEGDANVYQDDCASSKLPCPAEDQRTPACEVAGPDVDTAT